MSTTPQLSPLQNDRLRAAMIELWEKRYDRNASHLARDMGLRQPTVSEFLRGKGGASYDTAKRFATLIHKSTDDVIGPDERGSEEIMVERGRDRISSYRDTPGYMEAFQEAIEQRPRWSPLVWERIGQEKVPGGRTQVLTADLITTGERLQRSAVSLKRKGYVTAEAAAPAPPPRSASPQKRYMSDVRRLAGIGAPAAERTSGSHRAR